MSACLAHGPMVSTDAQSISCSWRTNSSGTATEIRMSLFRVLHQNVVEGVVRGEDESAFFV